MSRYLMVKRISSSSMILALVLVLGRRFLT